MMSHHQHIYDDANGHNIPGGPDPDIRRKRIERKPKRQQRLPPRPYRQLQPLMAWSPTLQGRMTIAAYSAVWFFLGGAVFTSLAWVLR